MPVGSGSANVRHSLTGGFVTLVPTRTGIWNLRSIEYTRTRRSASILKEYLMWNRKHLPRQFLRQRVGWEIMPQVSLQIGRAHCLKERRAIFLSHLLDKSSSFVCAFAICSCLLKRLRLTNPYNRTAANFQSSLGYDIYIHTYIFIIKL